MTSIHHTVLAEQGGAPRVADLLNDCLHAAGLDACRVPLVNRPNR